MVTKNATLGVCPFCGSILRAGSVILEYKVNGERRVYADCEECNEPVHPE
jgi:formate dehydrogenase maturation protein FdhE